ncbi:MAG: peptide-N-glycosidase F-related protein [Myxococcota bacterium]
MGGLWRRWASVVSIAGLCAGCASTAETPAAGESSTGAAQSSGSTTSGDDETPESTTTGGMETSSSSGGDSSTGTDLLEPAGWVLMESVVFYDGYAKPVDEPVPDGVLRLNNALYAVRITDDQLDQIQPNLQMQVLVGALCDNYDRLGHVNLAFVPKGAAAYEPGDVVRVEIARFVTPFMNKNREPDTVPFEWDIPEVASILTNPDLRAAHDIWLELSVFGVPYAANTEVSGCDGRNDVFRGWVALRTDSEEEGQAFDAMTPLAINERFNSYQEGASDALGLTRKTVPFELSTDAAAAQLVLITSNHGANAGGEEYNRRDHHVYVDGALVLEYKPGRETCEPFREYNTQGNGIYGPTPKTDEEWQSFSNWCPGDVIDTRILELGPLSAGTHEFMIEIPDAVFADDQGDVPFSLYLQTRED